jgi:hypothetical protein
MGLDTKTYSLTDRQSQCDLDLDLGSVAESGESNFDTPACQDMSFGSVELIWVENSGK